MNRRNLLKTLGIGAAGLTLGGVTLADENLSPPNILLIVSDDQGYGDTSGYWNTDVDTPVMDAVGANGVRFTQFRVNPLCAPTRASLFSGQYSLECGMWRGPSQPGRGGNTRARKIKEDVQLLPQYLKQAGYATGMFGKWHLGYESPNVPNERGFDEFVGFLGGAHPYQSSRQMRHNGEPLQTDEHLTDLFTNRAIDFIREHQTQPFFCYVPYNAVHGPLWRKDAPRPSGKTEWLQKYEKRGVDFPRRDYNAVLDHMDHSVGRILQTLKDLDLEENTLVIYLSDNGALIEKYPGDNGPLRGEKAQTYEGGIRVPAVMQWPGVIPKGQVSDAGAVHFDIFATVLNAAGVPIPQTNGQHPVHGLSLLEHLKSAGQANLPDRTLFWDLFGRMAAVSGPWKLVGMGANHRGQFSEAIPAIEELNFELYRIDKDIGENQNLADQHPEIYIKMKREFIHWFQLATQ